MPEPERNAPDPRLVVDAAIHGFTVVDAQGNRIDPATVEWVYDDPNKPASDEKGGDTV